MHILNQTLSAITPQSELWRAKARERLDQLIMPHWALGRLMDLAVDLAGITHSLQPPTNPKIIVIMAADHGVVAEGVSRYPQEITWQMVANFMDGGASINALAGQVGADVQVVDMGIAQRPADTTDAEAILSLPIAPGTANMAKGPAMHRAQAITAIENGIRVARQVIQKQGYELFGVGEMGIGNTTASSAIIATLSGQSVAASTGHGTGLDDRQMAHKIAVIEQALAINRPDRADGLDVLAKVGGFEIGGIAGLILGAAAQGKPIVMDGLISTAGALIAQALSPTVTDYLIAAHRSVERGHIIALDRLGKEPLLDLQLRLGEGTGAALAMNLVETASRVLREVRTFAEAGMAS